MKVTGANLRRLSARCSRSNRGRRFPWNGKGSRTTPEYGYPLAHDAPGCQEGRDRARPIDGVAPMEPPIGYGSTHRSIFPESQFGTTAAPRFRGPGRATG